MINYKLKKQLKESIIENINELRYFEKIYNQKLEIGYKNIEDLSSILEKELDRNNIDILNVLINKSKETIKECEKQLYKINKNSALLTKLLEKQNSLSKREIKKRVKKYNMEYEELKEDFILNVKNNEDEITEDEETIETDYTNNIDDRTEIIDYNSLENNDTLLVSEILNKVILPYTAEEVIQIFEDDRNNYKSINEVIESEFTRPLANYRFQFWSRYKETMKLATEREGYSIADAITLALEITKKRFLYPAIITACRNIDELDVYLDCLDKNELDDFKIFKVKYELYPTIINKDNQLYIKKGFIERILDFLKSSSKKNVDKKQRYI